MRRRWSRTISCALIAAAGMLAGAPCRAQPETYPSRTVRIVIPFPAGGPADIVGRLIAQKMSEAWGQPVVVENRPGANTIIGAQFVAKSPPDGHTLLMAIDSTLVMNQFLYKSLPYDPLRDFSPITLTTKSLSVLAVPAATGPKSVKELIARAKAEPGKLNYGAGTITAQLMGHLFHKAANIDIVYVPFKGTAETAQGLLTGAVQLIYGATPVVGPLVESGQVRALAKLDSRTVPAVAGLPTLAEAAELKNFDDMSVWLGLVAPNGTPRPIIDKIQREVARILNDPAVQERSARTGNFAGTSTPEEFAIFIAKEAERWGKALKEIGLKYD